MIRGPQGDYIRPAAPAGRYYISLALDGWMAKAKQFQTEIDRRDWERKKKKTSKVNNSGPQHGHTRYLTAGGDPEK